MDPAPIGLITEFAVGIIFIGNDTIIRHGLDFLEELSRLTCILQSSFMSSEIEFCGGSLCLAEFLALLAEDFGELGWRFGMFLDGSGEIETLHSGSVNE